MNHLESTFTGKNSVWRYIVMVAVILLAANTAGAIPLLIALIIKSGSNPDVFSMLASNPDDFSVLQLDLNVSLIIMLFPFIAGLAAFILLVKPLNYRTLRKTINGTDRIRWHRFFISGVIWLLLSMLYLFMFLKIDPANYTLNNTTASLILLSLISVVFIPFQAAFEELLFRGYLMQGFAALIRNRWFPLIMTSVLFGLMHAFNPEVKRFGFITMMPQYILFGLIFGIITILDDGIEAAMGAHAANNIFLCIMITNDSSALQTPALFKQLQVFPWTEFAALFAVGALFILILSKLFRWNTFPLLFRKIVI